MGGSGRARTGQAFDDTALLVLLFVSPLYLQDFAASGLYGRSGSTSPPGVFLAPAWRRHGLAQRPCSQPGGAASPSAFWCCCPRAPRWSICAANTRPCCFSPSGNGLGFRFGRLLYRAAVRQAQLAFLPSVQGKPGKGPRSPGCSRALRARVAYLGAPEIPGQVGRARRRQGFSPSSWDWPRWNHCDLFESLIKRQRE